MYSNRQRKISVAMLLSMGIAVHSGVFAEAGKSATDDNSTKTNPLLVEVMADSGYKVVSLEALEEQRGKRGVIDVETLAQAQLNGELSGNVAINTVNGNNIIDNGSFKEASGLISVIQNTGNNVLIQDSTVVNVTILP